MEYEAYLLNQMAKKELASEQNLPEDSITEEEIAAQVYELQQANIENTSEEVMASAATWLDGFERMSSAVESGLPNGPRETMIFSILGRNLLVHLCKELEVNTERLTVQKQRDLAAMVREFQKILVWIGANKEELSKDVPRVK